MDDLAISFPYYDHECHTRNGSLRSYASCPNKKGRSWRIGGRSLLGSCCCPRRKTRWRFLFCRVHNRRLLPAVVRGPASSARECSVFRYAGSSREGGISGLSAVPS